MNAITPASVASPAPIVSTIGASSDVAGTDTLNPERADTLAPNLCWSCRASDDEQRLRAVRIAGAVLHREPLRVVQVSQGSGANWGEHVGRKQGLRFVRKGGRNP